MTPEEVTPHLRRVLRDTRKLYVDSGRWLVSRHKTLLGDRAAGFVDLMDDLHRGLLIKVYTEIIRSDNRWTGMEKFVGTLLIEHLWDERLRGSALREAAESILAQADALNWSTLVRPFVAYEPLHEKIGHVETVVMRLANLVAKCDGLTTPDESQALHQLQQDITAALGGSVLSCGSQVLPHETLPGAAASRPNSNSNSQNAMQQQQAEERIGPVASKTSGGSQRKNREPAPEKTPQERLQEATDELEKLIGLSMIKERVRSLTNFLRLQRQREQAGLPTMPIGLHMAFVGNPGTGKTTVARIVGQILGAMGILKSGHLVETDRSGLVAEYAGQTTAKTNKLIDSALDGVLFIDEAYSLISDRGGDDQYGREAIQILLKRMEDNRDRIVVILAGYPEEMDEMIRSNPGLSSRVNTKLEFEDYQPADLGQIFELLCKSNHFRLPPTSRHRLLVGLDELHRERDRHFGNGRLARNAFEECVRRLADRVADIAPLTPELLSVLEPEDIIVPGIADNQLEQLIQQAHTLRTACTHCKKRLKLEGRMLGCRLRCPNCQTEFKTGWADVEKS
ncbi:AAA family ATPase [Planctomycetaceae bacterium SH139]